MKLRHFLANGTDHENEFKLSFSRPADPEENNFSILIGANGTRKSRTLRDILYFALLRSRDFGVSHVGKAGGITLWPDEYSLPSDGISKVLAISGVATDRFPSRITGKRIRGKSITYAYIGPRSENNLVSRLQSTNLIVRYVLEDTERVRRRYSQLKSVFAMLQVSPGIMFKLKPTELRLGEEEAVDSLRKRLQMAFPTEDEHADVIRATNVVSRCIRILHRSAPIEVRLDLDDEERISTSPGDTQALYYLLVSGAISVTDSYVYDSQNRPLNLDQFSSGQWQILSSLLFASIAVENNALVLIDEPENSLHPAWQQRYLPFLKKVISGASGVHVIVATHSPLIAASLHPDFAEVIQIRSRANGLISRRLRGGPFGWSSDQILKRVFGLHSDRSISFTRKMDKALMMLARGQRRSPELHAIVESLAKTLPTLPDDDVVTEIIKSLVTIVAESQ